MKHTVMHLICWCLGESHFIAACGLVMLLKRILPFLVKWLLLASRPTSLNCNHVKSAFREDKGVIKNGIIVHFTSATARNGSPVRLSNFTL